LVAELDDLLCLDLSPQVELPKLLSPALERLCEALAEGDKVAGDAVIDDALDEVDTALERAQLARAVIAAREAGRCAPGSRDASWSAVRVAQGLQFARREAGEQRVEVRARVRSAATAWRSRR
jgi:hypothetical protein